MNFPISLYIALRYWRAKSADRFGRLVTNLASLGIVLGVMALIIVLSVMNGLEGYQKQQVLSSIPHAIVSEEQPISTEKTLENLPHFIQKAVPINTTNVIYQTTKGVSAGQIIGIQSFLMILWLNLLIRLNLMKFCLVGNLNWSLVINWRKNWA